MDQELRDHIQHDDARFDHVSKTFDHVSETLDKIKNNHLAHIELSVASLKADMAWVKWIALAFIGGLIAVYFKK